ncbi:MAG TPA: response regulator transcription factor [Pseudonocardiaceae bacterium]|jgi:DNA-binding response OmpR family regulator|nr:response regulator transcription factor [Pseudonocardiaceae bacterium]
MRILLVEDDDQVVEALVPALDRRGFAVERLAEGRFVLDRLVGVDVVLLDLRLPDMDGVALCRRIRAISDVPIIVVSALGDVSDRILGLHAGADDYMVKPYDEGELVARVHAVVRRGGGAHPPVGTDGEVIAVGDVEIHLSSRQVLVAGDLVVLPRKQFQLLTLIAQAGGAVCTRERIMVEVWQNYASGQEAELDGHVGQIRAALDRPWIIETVFDVGYRLGRPPARQSR